MRLTFQWLTLATTLIITTVYWLTTIDYPAESIAFPRIVMVAMLVGAGAAVLRHDDRISLTGLGNWARSSRSARLLALLLLYLPLYQLTGFAASSISFLIAAFWSFGIRGILGPVVAVTAVALLYAVFSVGLNVIL